MPPDLPGPSSDPARHGPARRGLTDGVHWTTTRSAWLKSLGGAAGVVLIALLLIALLPGVALSDLWPSGNETSSIGSETLAGPVIDATSTTDGATGGLGDGVADAESASAEPTDLLDPSSTATTSSPTTATTVVSTTPTTAASTSSSTLSTTATTASTTSSNTTETTATTGTTATTTDTSRTTSTGQDTSSSSPTSETTETTQPPPPRIVRFTSRVADPNLPCNRRNNRVYEAIWATENTKSVELSLPNGARVPGKPTGVYPFCGQPGDTILLVASGPGGEDKASTTLD